MMAQSFGAYAGYIISAYALSALILGAMTIGSVMKARRARARLEALEARGHSLRDFSGS